MLAKLGCQFVLAGHSERRQYHGEGDALVAAKVRAALRSSMSPVLCVGETLEVRQAGSHVGHNTAEQIGGVAVAYEPVWAIGTGEVATPENAQEMCGAIRSRISAGHTDEVAAGTRILYGGSVKTRP